MPGAPTENEHAPCTQCYPGAGWILDIMIRKAHELGTPAIGTVTDADGRRYLITVEEAT